MWRLLAAPFAQSLRRNLDRGISALVWAGATAIFGVLGIGLLLASALLGLSALLGPVLATGLLGLLLLAVALVLANLNRGRSLPASETDFLSRPQLATTMAPLSQFGFVFGFVAARVLLRRLDQGKRG